MDHIDFITEDGQMESCEVNRKTIHEAFLYIEKAAAPYITRRKEQLVSYVLKRTEDFHMVFGIDEQIEINEETGSLPYSSPGRQWNMQTPAAVPTVTPGMQYVRTGT